MRLEVEISNKAYTNVAGERQQVLADLGFSLDAGEMGVLVGPSGCGKSTLLRILAGLDRDYEGRVSRPPDARIGMVFQEPRLLPWRSVRKNVALLAELEGASKEERTRLARELHDSVSQALFGIGLGARTARTLLDRDPANLNEGDVLPHGWHVTMFNPPTPQSRLRHDGAAQQGVLHHLQLGAFLAEASAQFSHFRNRKTHVVGHDDSAGVCQDAFQRLDRLSFLSAVHCGLRYSR